MSGHRPTEEIILTPELKKIFRTAFIEEVETWSIGKLRAFLEDKGIHAQKLKRHAMVPIVQKIMVSRATAIRYEKEE